MSSAVLNTEDCNVWHLN